MGSRLQAPPALFPCQHQACTFETSRWTHRFALGLPLLCFHFSVTGSCAASHVACSHSLGSSCWLPRLCSHLAVTTSLARSTASRWIRSLAPGLPQLRFYLSGTSSCTARHAACGHSLGSSGWLPRLCPHLSVTTSLARLTASRWTHNLALGLPLLCFHFLSQAGVLLCRSARRMRPFTGFQLLAPQALFPCLCHNQL